MQQERTFYASRAKAVLIFCGSLAFVVLGWWLKEQKPLIGWASILFFGLGIPTAIIMMVPGVMYLRLDSEGLEFKSIGRSGKIKWQDVKAFRIVSIRSARMIAIEYQPTYTSQKIARAAASAISGMEGAIPNSYNISLQKLEQELNMWLARFESHATPTASG